MSLGVRGDLSAPLSGPRSFRYRSSPVEVRTSTDQGGSPMSTPSAPAQDAPSDEVFLGTGAYGDPAQPELSRTEYIEQESPEEEPANPSSDPTPISGPA